MDRMEKKMKKALNITLSVITVIAISILTVTASIGLPIYIRPFYYMQIDELELPEKTGFTKEEIIDAYDELLDYLTLPGKEFGTGVFKYSEEGKSHFVDCKGLFDLNAIALFISLGVLITVVVLWKKKKIELSSLGGFGLPFASGVATLSLFAVIGVLAALDFDRAFVIFHSIFFPGKDNWIFHPSKDQIINAMPQDFFMRCAILIGVSIILVSLALVGVGIYRKAKQQKAK